MKTIESVIELYKGACLDGRDVVRLGIFGREEQLPLMGLEMPKGETHTPIPFTRENVLEQLRLDVDFGFEKALNRRGISASFMFEVVKMWNWVLEEGLEDWSDSDYAQYGLPLFKATALKYGFDNPIGDDAGDEYKYSAEAQYDDEAEAQYDDEN